MKRCHSKCIRCMCSSNVQIPSCAPPPLSLSVITDPLSCCCLQSSVSIFNFFPPPVSLRNKAEIPSGVRRDWRGNSVQWGGEALSPCPPQCVQPCRTLHRQAAAKQKGSGRKSYSGGQRAGPDQRSLPRSRWLTGRWAWARGIFLGVLFRDAFLLSLPRRIPSPLPL